MKAVENTVLNFSGSFPNAKAVNSTGAGTTDGTEFTESFINNFLFGISQAVLDYSSITPSGVTEAAGNSQFIEAMQKGAALLPGLEMAWNLNVDPAAIGFRGLLLNGQGILRANYPELDSNCYVGDANNTAVATAKGGFYRANNADGSSPNIAGIYLILPESRGYVPRGLDIAASVDPDGSNRKLGDNQADAMQRITGGWQSAATVGQVLADGFASGVFQKIGGALGFGLSSNSSAGSSLIDFDSSNSISPNQAKTDDNETRGANRSTKFVIIY